MGEGWQESEGTKAIYEGLCERQWGEGEEWLGWTRLWRHRMQGGLRMWIWKVWKGGILVRGRMKEKWGIGDGKCMWCGDEETVRHVVKDCSMTERWTATWAAVAGVGAREVERWWEEGSRGEAISEMVVVVRWMGVWELWNVGWGRVTEARWRGKVMAGMMKLEGIWGRPERRRMTVGAWQWVMRQVWGCNAGADADPEGGDAEGVQ